MRSQISCDSWIAGARSSICVSLEKEIGCVASMNDTAPRPLQESILAALIFDDRAGAAIAAQVIPAYFDDSYRVIAERILVYRRKYGKAPGGAHLDDLFDKHLFDQKSHTRQLLMDLAGLSRSINPDYVLSRTNQFVREQNIKAAL